MRNRRPRAWTATMIGCLAAASALALGGCGAPDGGSAAQAVTVNLAAAKTAVGNDAPTPPHLALALGDRFTVTGQENTAQLSRLDLAFSDGKGRKAALVRVAVIFGEPDQSLDEKFAALTDEAKVSVALKDTYQPAGAPVDFTTADGIAGQLRRYEFMDSNNQKQLHGFAVLDLRKQDAVYVRIQLLTPAGNWERLQPDFMGFVQSMKRVMP